MKHKKIAVLVSGGVDSSVALALLKEAGHDVHAYYLKIWLEDELSYLGSCPWEEDLAYAQQVCTQLDVPLTVVPLQKEYHQRVVSYTIDAVSQGLTPNPDMMCNREVKFGAFCDWLSQQGLDYERIASGHYAWVEQGANGPELFRAPDDIKDQTYFLAMMSRAQLAQAYFPLGQMTKAEVRAAAAERVLPTATRKDSQGICFLGKISFTEFIKHHCGERAGEIVDSATGEVLGTHQGFYFYTIGQRKGLDLPGGPWYVCGKDAEKNTIYVSHGFRGEDTSRDRFCVEGCNWLSPPPQEECAVQVKIRHGAALFDAVLTPEGADRYAVHLAQRDQSITPGQYAVFYDDTRCLGAGVITV